MPKKRTHIKYYDSKLHVYWDTLLVLLVIHQKVGCRGRREEIIRDHRQQTYKYRFT